MRELHARLGSPETKGTKALYAAIVAELTPDELAIVQRVADGNEPAHVLDALLPPRHHDEERDSYYFQQKAGVVWGAGWVFKDEGDAVVDIGARRKTTR